MIFLGPFHTPCVLISSDLCLLRSMTISSSVRAPSFFFWSRLQFIVRRRPLDLVFSHQRSFKERFCAFFTSFLSFEWIITAVSFTTGGSLRHLSFLFNSRLSNIFLYSVLLNDGLQKTPRAIPANPISRKHTRYKTRPAQSPVTRSRDAPTSLDWLGLARSVRVRSTVR